MKNYLLIKTFPFIFIVLLLSACRNESVELPVAEFVISPAKGDVNTTFTFNAATSHQFNNDTTGLLFRWDFENDGIWDTEWSKGKTYYKRYVTPGYYNVGLEVKAPGGLIAWVSRSLWVTEGGATNEETPVATFTVSPTQGDVGTVFTFDASGVSDAQDPTDQLKVRWDFNGDGTWDTDWNTHKITTHVFNASATYTVNLQVMDTDGHTAITSRNITVGTTPPGNQTIELQFITIQGGTFTMGCTAENEDECNFDEFPRRQVTVSTFEISKYETTNGQYAQFLNAINCNPDGTFSGKKYIYIGHDNCKIYYAKGSFKALSGYENMPVVTVTWTGAKAFATYYNGDLPTEAQWEFAARGGNSSHNYPYSGSSTLDDVAWYAGNSYATFKEAGTKQANELGIYDMSGNAQEWCRDWYAWDYYGTTGDVTDPLGPDESSNDSRCVRGGSVYNGPDDCRSSDRYWYDPDSENKEIGFRIVK